MMIKKMKGRKNRVPIIYLALRKSLGYDGGTDSLILICPQYVGQSIDTKVLLKYPRSNYQKLSLSQLEKKKDFFF
eukprot:UN10911